MANYVAELILNAQAAKSPKDRRRLHTECAQEILTIWHHRASVPHGIHPLRDLSEVLKAMVCIAKPDPWHRETFANQWLNLALTVKRSSQFLIQVLLRAAINKASTAKAKRFAADFGKLLSPAERNVIQRLGEIADAHFVFGAKVDITRGEQHSISIRKLSPEEIIDRTLKTIEAEIKQILAAVSALRNLKGGERAQLVSDEPDTKGKKTSSSHNSTGNVGDQSNR